jgi:hypothetical protein
MINKKHMERTFAISAYFYGSAGLRMRFRVTPPKAFGGIFLQKDSRCESSLRVATTGQARMTF